MNRWFRMVAVVVGLSVLAAGCGGDEPSAPPSPEPEAQQAKPPEPEDRPRNGAEAAEAQPDRFGVLRRFGQDASRAQRAEIRSTVRRYLGLVSAGGWAAACDMLSRESLERARAQKPCPESLPLTMKPLLDGLGDGLARAHVSTVRVEA